MDLKFLLDAVETNQFYKTEMIRWLEDTFPDKLPRGATELQLLAFLRAKTEAHP